MPRGDKIADEEIPTHLFLLGDTKTGKSDYVAHAILDGFYCLYIDSDNGGPTLMKLIPEGHEARKRFFHIRTKNPYAILKNFTELPIFRWNETADKEFIGPTGHDPNDNIIEIKPGKIPRGFLVVFDGWTGISLDAMRLAAKNNSTSLSEMGKAKAGQKRNIYQEAGTRLNAALDILQKFRAYLIVQGHGAFYERKEKPPGVNNADEDEMIIKETLLIPYSTSQPHGHGMGKYFNEIAWTTVDKNGNRVLDFNVKADRIGGGSVTGVGDPRKEFSFTNLFCKNPIQYSDPEIDAFYKEFKAGEFVTTATPAAKPATSPAAPTGNLPPAGTPTGETKAAPSRMSLMLKK